MKRAITYLLIILAATALAGCSSPPTDTADAPTDTQPDTTTDDQQDTEDTTEERPPPPPPG